MNTPKKFEDLTFADHNDPRFLRARRFADHARHLLRDFLPPGRDTQRLIYDHLIRTGWEQNLEIVTVPPEWDALDKIELERARLEVKITTVTEKTK